MIIKIIFMCFAGFIAAFVDSIAGGGGLISIPAFLIIGAPVYYTLGTNKFSASCGSLISSFGFFKSGKLNLKMLKILAPFTLAGAVLGVNTALRINEKFLNTLVLILILFVGIYTVFSKTMGQQDNFKGLGKKNLFLGILLAFSLGFYDGFFGPGTGSFLIFGLISIFGFDFVCASGNAKVLNLVSNVTSLVLFAINGRIYYIIGIPMAIFMILGARLGTKLALNKGTKLIKPIFVAMSLAVAVKMLYGLF